MKYAFLNFEWGNLNVQVSTPGVASAYKPCQSLGPTPAATQSWFYNPSMTNKSQRARVFFPKCFKLHSSNLSSKSFYYSGHQVSSRLRTISTLTRKLSLSNPRYVWSNQVKLWVIISLSNVIHRKLHLSLLSPHHVPIPLSATWGKNEHITMQPESCFLSKQGVKKARTGITGCCSLTVRGASIPLRPCPDPLSCDIAPMSPLNRNHPSLSPLQSSPS